MEFAIVPIAPEHIQGFRAAVDIVAREKKYLAFLEAPPLEETTKFVLNNIEQKNPQFVVLSDRDVVGWCDVLRNTQRTVYSHCGTLGIGLLQQFRGRGIGRQLMQTTIDAAWQCGMTRIELVSESTTPMRSRCTRASALGSRDFSAMLFASMANTRMSTRWPF